MAAISAEKPGWCFPAVAAAQEGHITLASRQADERAAGIGAAATTQRKPFVFSSVWLVAVGLALALPISIGSPPAAATPIVSMSATAVTSGKPKHHHRHHHHKRHKKGKSDGSNAAGGNSDSVGNSRPGGTNSANGGEIGSWKPDRVGDGGSGAAGEENNNDAWLSPGAEDSGQPGAGGTVTDFDPLPEQPSPDATEDLGGPSNDPPSLPDGPPNPSVAGELTPVPDPSALSLFAIGLVVIALIARRRRIEI